MKFKLDKNFGTRTQAIFHAAGHNVETVVQESLSGAADLELYQVCQDEERCLVTLDLDFTNVFRFSPAAGAGIAVIRAPKNMTLPILEQLVRQFLQALETIPIEGKLWIVEVGRIRIHQADDDE